jgi:hypothetical protein
MSGDNRSISGSVTVQQDAKERVAFDLMIHIASNESGRVKDPRDYFLELYSQCHLAVRGATLETILRKT